jgi:predicted neuraminidase
VLPQNNSGLDAVSLRDGRQLLVYNHSRRNDASNGRKGRCILNVSVSKDGNNWRAALLLNHLPENFDQVQFSYPGVIQGRDGLVHIVHTWHRLRMKHVIINPYKLTDDVTVAMPDGKWPTSGPLSVAEFPESKREDPRKMP